MSEPEQSNCVEAEQSNDQDQDPVSIDWSKYEGKTISLVEDTPESRLVLRAIEEARAQGRIEQIEASSRPRGTRSQDVHVKQVRESE